jgi:hypothetical protein
VRTFFAATRAAMAFALIVAGVCLWSIPAGLITAGVLLLIDSLT